MLYFTSSWDDGSVYDLRLAELLLKYGQKATFYVPLFNVEKREVISANQIIDLSREFEIGAHTINHKYLTTISNAEAEYEIKQSKKELESIINTPVFGFCFPGGKYRPIHLQYVYEAGFKYARTINMFKFRNDSKIMNTTLHAYNHSRYTYFKHLIKRGYFNEIIQNSITILTNNKWDKLLYDILDKHIKDDLPQKVTIVHIWGHSWELEENNMWKQLEMFLEEMTKNQILSKTNFEAFQLSNNNRKAI